MTFHISSTVSMGSFVIKYHGSFFIRPTTSQSGPAYFACLTGSATTLILRQHRFCTSHTSLLVHQRIVATTGTPCIPRSNIPIHSIPKTVIGFPVGGFHTPFLCFLKRTALLDFTAQSPSVFSLSVFSITLSSHTFNASSPDFSSSSILSSAFIKR